MEDHIIKLLKTSNKEKNLKAARVKTDILHTVDQNLWVTVDFLLGTIQAVTNQNTVEQYL